MFIINVGFAIWVSYYDLKFHRIPNTALIIFSLICIPFQLLLNSFDVCSVGLASAFLFLSIALATLADMGAGDVKLLTLCALTIIPPSWIGVLTFFLTLCVCVLVHVLITFCLKRTVCGYLPLAPSILVSAIWSASGA